MPPKRDGLAAAIAAAGGLANQSDLARLWDVSVARAGQLVQDPTFPAPVATVGGRPAWAVTPAMDWREQQRTRRRGPAARRTGDVAVDVPGS